MDVATAQYRKQAKTHPHDNNMMASLVLVYLGYDPQRFVVCKSNSPASRLVSFLLPILLLTGHNKAEEPRIRVHHANPSRSN